MSAALRAFLLFNGSAKGLLGVILQIFSAITRVAQ
jgi:hypothetical protein